MSISLSEPTAFGYLSPCNSQIPNSADQRLRGSRLDNNPSEGRSKLGTQSMLAQAWEGTKYARGRLYDVALIADTGLLAM